MKSRTRSILEAGMHDYIKTGSPITSERLYEEYDFGIKPAMIRWELNLLSELGYLSQTHPSGGRIPTNKAYRFFVNTLLEDKEKTERPLHGAEHFLSEFARGAHNAFVDHLSDYLQVLSIGFEPGEGEVYRSGLDALVENLEIENRKDLLEVVRDFELLPERISESQVFSEDGLWPKIFIGGSPITKSEHVSVLAHRIGGESNFFLIAIGPKRMDYKKPLTLFRYFDEFLETK